MEDILKIKNEEFEGEFEPRVNSLLVTKIFASLFIVPSHIEVNGIQYEVNHLQFPSMGKVFTNVKTLTLPSTLLSIGTINDSFSGVIEAPDNLECLMELKIKKCEENLDKMFTKYDNAYYFGNKENPYAYLFVATSDDIESCKIHKDTKYICSGAFINCYKYTKVILPDNLKGIGSFAFNYDNFELNEYNNGYYIGSESNPYFAYLYCDEEELEGDEYYVHEDTRCLLEMPQEYLTIYLHSKVTMYPFYTNQSLEEYLDNIKFLEEPEGYHLYGNDCLCKKVKGQLVGVIGRLDQRVFDDVTVVNFSAFRHASKEDLIIPPHIEYINDAYYGEEFVSIYLSKDSKLHPFTSRYFHKIPNLYFDGNAEDFVSNPANCKFNDPKQKQYFKNKNNKYELVKEITISKSPENSFHWFSSLEKVTILEGIEEIGKYAFSYCKSLKEVTLPTSLKKIGSSCFSNCTSLKEIIIPVGVEVIENCMFDGSNALEKIYLPKTIKKIEFGFLGISEPKDSKVTIYYDGTYEDFLNIDIRSGRYVIEKHLVCRGMDSLTYRFNKALRDFKYLNIPFDNEKCWWMVAQDIVLNDAINFKVVDHNSYKPYLLDKNDSKIAKSKNAVDEDLIFSVNVCVKVEIDMIHNRKDYTINDFIESIISGISNCYDEINEMNIDDYIDVDELPIYEYFKSIRDNPSMFIKELNALRSVNSPLPMYIYKIAGYDVALYIDELLYFSKEDYHKYFSEEEILDLLEQKNKIKL